MISIGVQLRLRVRRSPFDHWHSDAGNPPTISLHEGSIGRVKVSSRALVLSRLVCVAAPRAPSQTKLSSSHILLYQLSMCDSATGVTISGEVATVRTTAVSSSTASPPCAAGGTSTARTATAGKTVYSGPDYATFHALASEDEDGVSTRASKNGDRCVHHLRSGLYEKAGMRMGLDT